MFNFLCYLQEVFGLSLATIIWLINWLLINAEKKKIIRYMQYYEVIFRNIMRGIHILLFCQRSISSLRALRSLFQQLFGIGGYLYDSIGRLIYQSTVVLKIFKPYYFLLQFETEKELKLFFLSRLSMQI